MMKSNARSPTCRQHCMCRLAAQIGWASYAPPVDVGLRFGVVNPCAPFLFSAPGFTNHAVSNFKLRARIFTLAPYHDSGLTRSKRMVKANKRQGSSSVVGSEVRQTYDEPAHAR